MWIFGVPPPFEGRGVVPAPWTKGRTVVRGELLAGVYGGKVKATELLAVGFPLDRLGGGGELVHVN
jgi:hypothetical protein